MIHFADVHTHFADDILTITIDGHEFKMDKKEAFTLQHVLNSMLAPEAIAHIDVIPLS